MTTIYNEFQDGSRFAVTKEQFYLNDGRDIKFEGTDNIVAAKITVDEETKFQTIIGFGGSHTGTVTYLLKQLPQTLQDFVYESYYSPTKGIGYTLTRVPIGGCDFDLSPWAYNEKPANDKNLSNFTKLNSRDLERVSFTVGFICGFNIHSRYVDRTNQKVEASQRSGEH